MSFDQALADEISYGEKMRKVSEVLLVNTRNVAITDIDQAKTFDELYLLAASMRRQSQDALCQAVQISKGTTPEKCGAENIENLASPARAAALNG